MTRGDTHSRLVGWLKLALPLAALVILSTLFLIADRIDPEAAIPYANVDVEDLARDPRMTTPSYAGLTSDGSALTLTAETARPAGEDNSALAKGVQARLDMPGGGHADIAAATAALDTVAGRLTMAGGVTITTSTGYTVTTDEMIARLDRTGAESSTAVAAEGPPGRITADSFTLSQSPDAGNPYLLVFSGRVKLLYQPGG